VRDYEYLIRLESILNLEIIVFHSIYVHLQLKGFSSFLQWYIAKTELCRILIPTNTSGKKEGQYPCAAAPYSTGSFPELGHIPEHTHIKNIQLLQAKLSIVITSCSSTM